ncbi:MAG TPA: asparagine synthase (glutamine-hydrolyzing) [Longimicrobiales bacterium]|nr:asparagine synthase (glutamine-hydrolyzing) [Longimicrobiales bacterium]
MCGIAGIVGPGASESRARGMARVQAHRGPDDEGVWTGPGVALSHRRLSILDLSSHGHEPMVSADGRHVLTFNGEVYNYLELRRELAGYPYRSRTDTEVILAAYARWGEACVERFVGMFAFALWDVERGVLFCARDRLGIKPFHYAWHRGDFLFASEVKGILAAGVPARPDADTWAAYLAHGVYDHGEATFFEGVKALPGGCTLTVRMGRGGSEGAASPSAASGIVAPVDATALRPRVFWDLGALTQDVADLSDREAEEGFLERFDDAVRLRLRSDVPLGVNLSGGLDSASLVATVDAVSKEAGALQTFTAAYADPRYDETDFAGRVPRRREWTRHVQRLAVADVWPMAVHATWHQEAPFGGISTLGYHHLHALAREADVTVLLEGQGVDEMLAGYRYFRPHHQLDLLESGDRATLRRELCADAALEGEGWRDGVARMRRVLDGGGSPVYQDGTAFLAPDTLAPAVAERAGAYPAFHPPYRDRLRNALYRDLRHTKLPRVLRMNDRLSMAFSRELREPYLDHRMVEWVFRLRPDQRIRLGRSKELLRRAMAGRLPDDVRLPPKRAVVSPQREWLRGPLAPGVEALLASERFVGRGLFDAARCRDAFRRFRAGEGSNAFFVWQWVGTELWFRRFVDGDEAVP